MNPILKYLKNLFASRTILGENTELHGFVKADMLMQRLVDDEKVPGLAISVLRDGGKIFQRGYGYADLKQKTHVQPQKTIFRIASVSKPIAATALAHMVADETIDLDASFYTYVPYYPKKRWDFTIRQLASHTAGIRGYQGKEYGLNEPYSIKESIAIFKDDDLLFEPGTDYHYNSYGWVLVSLAMQEASGVLFENYVQEKVLKPLGMENTFAEQVSELSHDDKNSFNRRSRNYTKNRLGFREAIPVNNFYKLAGGGYLSTSEDIAKLGQAYLDGNILDEEIISQFLTSETIDGQSTYYGLGWQVSEDKQGRPYYGHIGNGVGGYSNFFVYPDEQMIFAILVNCTDPKVQEELDEVMQTLLDSYEKF
ncbi:serine hydrolase domain-containing protein [Costertonia aggregata]|uniref:Beta-lactamase family protein n=1 Tax=Costertonia aggregata TaxID=343403 RepID=A0A7H9ALX2_9FLAO|nr:serine hydrolase domain-containing protein [Costertonia aggregata]QLG44441.1 beta-lactamase family protein [Costertonia aggregata]